jgi:hypothetical protein
MYVLDERVIQPGTPFEHNGTSYPSNWIQLSLPEERAAIGIVEIEEQQRPDDRFYWVTQNADWTWSKTPKDLEQLKVQWKDIFKHQAYGLLLPSDWMIVRKSEDGTAVPADWTSYREAVRTTCALAITDMEATTEIEAFITAVTTVQWPRDPNSIDAR